MAELDLVEALAAVAAWLRGQGRTRRRRLVLGRRGGVSFAEPRVEHERNVPWIGPLDNRIELAPEQCADLDGHIIDAALRVADELAGRAKPRSKAPRSRPPDARLGVLRRKLVCAQCRHGGRGIGAVVLGGASRSRTSERFEKSEASGFLQFASVRADGTGERVKLAKGTPHGAFAFYFCSVECLRSFLNERVDELVENTAKPKARKKR